MDLSKKYKRDLIAGSVISLCILTITTSASWISIGRLVESQKRVNHTHEVLFNLEQVISAVKDAETGQRGFLLTGDALFLEPYNGAQERVWIAFARVSALTAGNPGQQPAVDSLEQLIKSRFLLLDRSVQKKKSGQPINWQNVEKGRAFMQLLRAMVSRMETREKVVFESRTEELNAFASFTPWIIIIASLGGIAITIVYYFRLTASYKQRLRMQEELVEKEKQMLRKINSIQKFAEEVSGGNYNVRMKREELN